MKPPIVPWVVERENDEAVRKKDGVVLQKNVGTIGPLNTNDPSIALDPADFHSVNTVCMDAKNKEREETETICVQNNIMIMFDMSAYLKCNMETYSREGLSFIYSRNAKKKKIEKIVELLSLCKETILERNLAGNTRCTIYLEPFLDTEVLQNLVYRLREIFNDTEIKLFGDDPINGQNGIEVDWTMPVSTYVVKEEDEIER
jgi:hypothetical protein